MKNVTVAQFAASLMNAIAKNPELGSLALNVEIEPGEEYKSIVGIEPSYRFTMMNNGKFAQETRMSIKLG